MKSNIISSILVSSVLALFIPQLAEARMTSAMVERALANNANSQHLHLLSKKDDIVKVHRRHHSKSGKRANTCKSSSSSSSNTYNGAGTGENDSSSSSSSSTKKASSTSTSAAASKATTSSSSSDDSDDVSPAVSSSSSSGSAASMGAITAFQGTNSGIGSWFRTDSGEDSTNGQSWCQTKYQDDWPCFAPSVGTMLKNFGSDYETAAKAYCGREAIVTNPDNGKKATMFICDGFDDKWVLSPGSIDLTTGAFTTLYGSFDGNKNTVIKGVEWELTGNVVSEGTFKSSG